MTLPSLLGQTSRAYPGLVQRQCHAPSIAEKYILEVGICFAQRLTVQVDGCL
jgi:hypothetical protein